MGRYILPSNRAFLVSVKALVRNKFDEILLLKVKRGLDDSERWDLPGGLLEINEKIENALAREVMEETGLVVKESKLKALSEANFANFEFEKNDVRDVRVIVLAFDCVVVDDENVVLSHEHESFGWFSLDELKKIETSRPTKGVVDTLIESKD